MTKILTTREYERATVWQKAAVLALMTDAQALARKKAKARAEQLRVLDAEFELAHQRLLQVEERRALLGNVLPTEAEYSRRWAVNRFNDPAGVGQQRLLEATAEAWA